MSKEDDKPNRITDTKSQTPSNEEAQPKTENKQKKQSYQTRSTIAQVAATLAFGTLIMGIGLVFSMPTIVIGSLLVTKKEDILQNFTMPTMTMNTTEEKQFSLDASDASWFGSIIFISQPIGSIISGFLQDTFGRKKCMMTVNIPQFIGWMMLYYSSNVLHLYLAGILIGLSIGFMEAPTLSYIGEMAEPRLRGTLSLMAGASAGVGCLLEFIIGAVIDWRTTMAISSACPVVAFLAISLIPDSPTWLICQGRISEAEQALCWLRGWVHPVCVRDEFITLLEYAKSPGTKEVTNIASANKNTVSNENVKDCGPGQNQTVTKTFALLLEPKLYRPLRLVLIYFFIAHCVSLLGVRPFMVPVFNSIGMPLKPHYVLVVTCILQLAGGLSGTLAMRMLGKRKVTILSLLSSVACCFILSGLIGFKDFVHPWLTLIFFCILFFTSGFGVCPLPWVLLSEVFPLDGRGIAGGISAACSYFFGFVVTKTYINFSDWFGINGTIAVYGIIGVAGFMFLFYNLPETEGKTLAEIEEYFLSDKKESKKDKDVCV